MKPVGPTGRVSARGALRLVPALARCLVAGLAWCLAVGLASGLAIGVVQGGAALAHERPAASPSTASPRACRGHVYLTLDTGNMRDADLIAGILARHQVRATFFVANERSFRGDHALDDAWRDWWRARVAEGHVFGSHTLHHSYFLGEAGGAFRVRPQFGPDAGKVLRWDAPRVCEEIALAGSRFEALTGRPLDPIWRAPGGRLPAGVDAAARACGWTHVPWTPAGFLGDELSSDTHPNDRLLARQLRQIGDGDILIAHLGIWSRKDPYAPMLDPLIAGLKRKGLCFKTIDTRKP